MAGVLRLLLQLRTRVGAYRTYLMYHQQLKYSQLTSEFGRYACVPPRTKWFRNLILAEIKCRKAALSFDASLRKVHTVNEFVQQPPFSPCSW